MKHPNGYGSVIRLGGNRRRPWAVRITDGWDINIDTGQARQIYKYISYHEERTDAMIALAEYNRDPFDLDARKTTFADMYDLWSKEKFKIGTKDEASKSSIAGYRSAFNNAKKLHDMYFNDIRAHHMQDLIDNLELGYSSKNNVRVLFSQMYEFARKNDIVEKDYSEFVSVSRDKKKTSGQPFTDKEIELLWNNKDKYETVIDAALIMIYSGLRIGELLILEKADINLGERFLTGGLKTEAGKDRVVPLNKKIIPILKKRKEAPTKSLFTNEHGNRLTYANFRKHWLRVTDKLGLTNLPHDCRHTFATLMNNANANDVAVKRIMGHSIQDITEGVYTHKDLEQLLKAIDLI